MSKIFKNLFTPKIELVFNQKTTGRSSQAILSCIKYCMTNVDKKCFYLSHNYDASRYFCGLALKIIEEAKIVTRLWFFKIKEEKFTPVDNYRNCRIDFIAGSQLIFMSAESFYRDHYNRTIIDAKTVTDHYAYEVELNKSIQPALDRKYLRHLKELEFEATQRTYDKEFFIPFRIDHDK